MAAGLRPLHAAVVLALTLVGSATASDKSYVFSSCKDNFLEVLRSCRHDGDLSLPQCCENVFNTVDRFCLCNKDVSERYPSAVEYFVAMQDRCSALGHWDQFADSNPKPFPCTDAALGLTWDSEVVYDSDYSDYTEGEEDPKATNMDKVKALWGQLMDADYGDEDDFGADDDDDDDDHLDWMPAEVWTDDDIAFDDLATEDDLMDVDYAFDAFDVGYGHIPVEHQTLVGSRADYGFQDEDGDTYVYDARLIDGKLSHVVESWADDDDEDYYMDSFNSEDLEEEEGDPRVMTRQQRDFLLSEVQDGISPEVEEVITTEFSKAADMETSCEGDEEECMQLLQAHLAYEGAVDRMDMNDDSLRPLGQSVSHLAEDLTPNLGLGEIVSELNNWVATLAKSMTGMLDNDSMGVVDEVDVEMVYEEQEELSPREIHLSGADIDLDIDIDIEIEIEELTGPADGNEVVQELEIDINLDIEAEDMSPEDLKKIPGRIAAALRKMNIPLDASVIAAQLAPQLHQVGGAREIEMEIEIEYEEEIEEVDSDLSAGDATVSVDSRSDDESPPKYWELSQSESQERQLPLSTKSVRGVSAPSALDDGNSVVKVSVNPDRSDEVFVTVEADEDEDVVLTLENESNEQVTLSIDDDLLNKHATIALDAGSSALVLSQDDSKRSFDLSVVPFIINGMDWAKPSEARNLQKYNLEVTSGHEIKVQQWDAVNAQLFDEDDIVIDMMHETTGQQVPGDDMVTIEVELMIDSSEDLDITVDVMEHMMAVETGDAVGQYSEGDPYLVITRLQQYIFRLECVFVLVYATVCLALLAIFYYLYQLLVASASSPSPAEDDDEDEDVEEAAAFSVNPAFMADAKARISVIFASDYVGSDEGYYLPLAEGEIPVGAR